MKSLLCVSFLIPADEAGCIRTGKGRWPACLVLVPYLAPATDYYWMGNLEECPWGAGED